MEVINSDDRPDNLCLSLAYLYHCCSEGTGCECIEQLRIITKDSDQKLFLLMCTPYRVQRMISAHTPTCSLSGVFPYSLTKVSTIVKIALGGASPAGAILLLSSSDDVPR